MKRLGFIFVLLLAMAFVVLADTYTVLVTVTNAHTASSTYSLNGSTRSWITSGTPASNQVLVGASTAADATNLYMNATGLSFGVGITPTVSTNSVLLSGGIGQGFLLSNDFSGWARQFVITNRNTGPMQTVQIPGSNMPASVATKQFSQIASDLNAYAAGILSPGTAMVALSVVPSLVLTNPLGSANATQSLGLVTEQQLSASNAQAIATATASATNSTGGNITTTNDTRSLSFTNGLLKNVVSTGSGTSLVAGVGGGIATNKSILINGGTISDSGTTVTLFAGAGGIPGTNDFLKNETIVDTNGLFFRSGNGTNGVMIQGRSDTNWAGSIYPVLTITNLQIYSSSPQTDGTNSYHSLGIYGAIGVHPLWNTENGHWNSFSFHFYGLHNWTNDAFNANAVQDDLWEFGHNGEFNTIAIGRVQPDGSVADLTSWQTNRAGQGIFIIGNSIQFPDKASRLTVFGITNSPVIETSSSSSTIQGEDIIYEDNLPSFINWSNAIRMGVDASQSNLIFKAQWGTADGPTNALIQFSPFNSSDASLWISNVTVQTIMPKAGTSGTVKFLGSIQTTGTLTFNDSTFLNSFAPVLTNGQTTVWTNIGDVYLSAVNITNSATITGNGQVNGTFTVKSNLITIGGSMVWLPMRVAGATALSRNSNGVVYLDASAGAFTITNAVGQAGYITQLMKTDSTANVITVLPDSNGTFTYENGQSATSILLSNQWEEIDLTWLFATATKSGNAKWKVSGPRLPKPPMNIATNTALLLAVSNFPVTVGNTFTNPYNFIADVDVRTYGVLSASGSPMAQLTNTTDQKIDEIAFPGGVGTLTVGGAPWASLRMRVSPNAQMKIIDQSLGSGASVTSGTAQFSGSP